MTAAFNGKLPTVSLTDREPIELQIKIQRGFFGL